LSNLSATRLRLSAAASQQTMERIFRRLVRYLVFTKSCSQGAALGLAPQGNSAEIGTRHSIEGVAQQPMTKI
jgi:hypothetical protein